MKAYYCHACYHPPRTIEADSPEDAAAEYVNRLIGHVRRLPELVTVDGVQFSVRVEIKVTAARVAMQS